MQKNQKQSQSIYKTILKISKALRSIKIASSYTPSIYPPLKWSSFPNTRKGKKANFYHINRDKSIIQINFNILHQILYNGKFFNIIEMSTYHVKYSLGL